MKKLEKFNNRSEKTQSENIEKTQTTQEESLSLREKMDIKSYRAKREAQEKTDFLYDELKTFDQELEDIKNQRHKVIKEGRNVVETSQNFTEEQKNDLQFDQQFNMEIRAQLAVLREKQSQLEKKIENTKDNISYYNTISNGEFDGAEKLKKFLKEKRDEEESKGIERAELNKILPLFDSKKIFDIPTCNNETSSELLTDEIIKAVDENKYLNYDSIKDGYARIIRNRMNNLDMNGSSLENLLNNKIRFQIEKERFEKNADFQKQQESFNKIQEAEKILTSRFIDKNDILAQHPLFKQYHSNLIDLITYVDSREEPVFDFDSDTTERKKKLDVHLFNANKEAQRVQEEIDIALQQQKNESGFFTRSEKKQALQERVNNALKEQADAFEKISKIQSQLDEVKDFNEQVRTSKPITLMKEIGAFKEINNHMEKLREENKSHEVNDKDMISNTLKDIIYRMKTSEPHILLKSSQEIDNYNKALEYKEITDQLNVVQRHISENYEKEIKLLASEV